MKGKINVSYEHLCDFDALYRAHIKARSCKRCKKPIVKFEMDLCYHLQELSEELKNKRYKISGYHKFTVFEPKRRQIQALLYRDRVVQHVICDDYLSDYFSKRAIYDNSACRVGKGQVFALNRLKKFLRSHFNQYGANGYFLKCDILKYFPSLSHRVIKEKFTTCFADTEMQKMFNYIIESHVTPKEFLEKYNIPQTHLADNGYGKIKEFPIVRGVPIGNQTSQIIGMYYLDPIDRLIKEKLRIKHYTRYMDDFLLIHPSKEYLQHCLVEIKNMLENKLFLKLNDKTQIAPLKNGIPYLGWNLYLLSSGKIIMKVRKSTLKRFKSRIKFINKFHNTPLINKEKIRCILDSYKGYLGQGNCYKSYKSILKNLKIGELKERLIDVDKNLLQD
ncbi:MAG: hypothetical protein J6C13_03275 [Clostridia bacterium]|nr:hypothetical protein [Clostridia bacterium]